MYDIGRRVIIKAPKSGYHNVVGHIADRYWRTDWVTGKREAGYLVEYERGAGFKSDVVLRSRDLRPADIVCDACGEWRKQSQCEAENVYAYGEIDDTFYYCFMCRVVGVKNSAIQPYDDPHYTNERLERP